jgi:hypothetical protein
MTPQEPNRWLAVSVHELAIVPRSVSMRELLERGVMSQQVFVVRDQDRIHPVWAADLLGYAFGETTTADEVERTRAVLRALYRSPRPVLDALADDGFWPGATRAVHLEHRELLHFHPLTRRLPARYVQTFAVVSRCASGKHVRGTWDGATCPTGLAWNADEPI